MPAATTDWRTFLRARFPAYLLPDSATISLDTNAAEAFVRKVSGDKKGFRAVRVASTLASRQELIAEFRDELEKYVRTLFARTHVERRVWDGGFAGVLDARATAAARAAGQRTRFITRHMRREFDHPEQVLVAEAARSLIATLDELRGPRGKELPAWAESVSSLIEQVRFAFLSSRLKSAPSEPIIARHLHAAHMSRQSCPRVAVQVIQHLGHGLTSSDAPTVSKILADGGLLPLSEDTQFELAVLLRVLEAFEARFTGGDGWSVERTVLRADRSEIARFSRGEESVLVYFNQSRWPASERVELARHYLGAEGRSRPDITIVHERSGQPDTITAVEVKNTTDPRYLDASFDKAWLYAEELRELSGRTPRVLLVVGGGTVGAPDKKHPVVMIDWARLLDNNAAGTLLLD